MTEAALSVEGLLYEEAHLLDSRRFSDWLALYASDAWYWAPISPDQTDPQDGLSHIYDDHALLEIRVDRLSGDDVIPQQPPSTTSRIVGNIQIQGEQNGLMDVRSRLHVIEFRPRPYEEDDHNVFAAAVRHRLRPTPYGLRIVSKRVDLVNASSALNAISISF